MRVRFDTGAVNITDADTRLDPSDGLEEAVLHYIVQVDFLLRRVANVEGALKIELIPSVGRAAVADALVSYLRIGAARYAVVMAARLSGKIKAVVQGFTTVGITFLIAASPEQGYRWIVLDVRCFYLFFFR